MQVLINRFGLPIGAAFASALLFVVTMKGTAIAMALAYLAPLPIMISTLGWGFLSGSISGGLASACVALAVDPVSGLLFGLTVALPSWALSSFCIVRGVRPPWRKSAAPADWTPVGAIVTFAVAIAAIVGLGGLVALIVVYGGYEKGLQAFADALAPAIEQAAGAGAMLPEGESLDDFALSIVRLSPAAIAGSTLLMLCVNLYAAARSTQLSQRLPRAWPDVPTSLVLPPALGAILVVALGAWLAAPEPISQFAAVLAGALGVAYVFQGLAVLHALSRRVRARPALIAALYLACIVAPKWVLPAVAAIGLIESVAALRARAAAPKYGS